MPVLPGNTAERLVELRKRSGLSQSELSKKLSEEGLGYFDRVTIGRAENGATTRINMELISALTEIYGVTADYILGLTDNPEKKNYEITELGLSYEAALKLIRREINPDALNRLLECESTVALCEMISAYFPSAMADTYRELADAFPEIRSLGNSADDLGFSLSEAEKKKLEADLSILRDPLDLQRGVVIKQFEVVVEELIQSMSDGRGDPEPIPVDNHELILQLKQEVLKRKRKADISKLTSEEQAEIIGRIVARKMNLRSDETPLFLELYKRMALNRMEQTNEKLRKAQ